jgi:hypothetical protein
VRRLPPGVAGLLAIGVVLGLAVVGWLGFVVVAGAQAAPNRAGWVVTLSAAVAPHVEIGTAAADDPAVVVATNPSEAE